MQKIFYFFLILLFLFSCEGKSKKQTEAGRHPRLSYEEYANKKWFYYYQRNELDSARELMEKDLVDSPSELPTLTLYAELLRRQKEYVLADSIADEVLKLDSSDGGAWLVKGDIRYPQYSTKNDVRDTAKREASYYYLQGLKRDSTDGNIWEVAIHDYLSKGDVKSYLRGLHRLHDHGHFTPKALEVAKLYLSQLPVNAILVTAGDMDTYPLLAVQEAEAFRKDVTIINYSLLNLPWYIKAMYDLCEQTLPCSEEYIDSLTVKMTPNERFKYKTVAKQFLDIIANDINRKSPLCLVANINSSAIDGLHTVVKGYYQEVVNEAPKEKYDLDAIASTLKNMDFKKLKGDFVSSRETSPILLQSNNLRRVDKNMILPYIIVALETRRQHDSIHYKIENAIKEYCEIIEYDEPLEMFNTYLSRAPYNKVLK